MYMSHTVLVHERVCLRKAGWLPLSGEMPGGHETTCAVSIGWRFNGPFQYSKIRYPPDWLLLINLGSHEDT